MSNEIEKLRSKIDEIDSKINDLLDERMNICRKIGYIKKKHNLQIRDDSREKEILDRHYKYKDIFIEILRKCRHIQESI